jgi:hypothetical protein
MALVLTGNLKLGTVLSGNDAAIDAGLHDVSDEVIHFKISAKVDTVEVPATMSTPIHGRGGAADYAITLGYLSNDIAGSFFDYLWDAVANGTKKLLFEGTMRGDVISAANPVWQGVFVVTEATVGAAAEQLSTGNATFPLVGPPSTGASEPA